MALLEAEIWGIADTGEGNMVFIRPLDLELSVPIFIGPLEAQSILIGFGGISVSRPLTADLLLSVIRHAGFIILRIEITSLRNNTFFARLVFDQDGEEFFIDARPSDALALAVRSKCPIFIEETVVDEVGVLAEDLETPARRKYEVRYDLLKAELEDAVAGEEYERAAKIRDMIRRLENEQENGGLS